MEQFLSLLLFLKIVFGGTVLSVSSFEVPKNHEIVVPRHLHASRLRRDLSTLTQNGHLDKTSFSLTGKGRSFVFDIYLNSQLLHKDYFEAYQLPNGTLAMNKEVEHCYYHGKVSGKVNSSVVLSTCNGLRGTIQDEDGKTFGIQPKKQGSVEHVFYDMEDVPKTDDKCGVDGESLSLHLPNSFANHFRFRRATTSLVDQRKYISLAIVNDKRQFEKMQNNLTLAVQSALEVANYVDQLYKTLNTRVAVVYVETWNVFNLAKVTSSGGETLSHFAGYNKNVLAMKLFKMGIRRDNAQLITGDKYSGGVVGMAGIGNICGINSCGVNGNRGHPANTAATMAHELGHNLGMGHDGGGCSCSKGPCVMAAVSGGAANSFTQCSKASLDKRVTDGLASCLFDVPEKLFSKPVCGNDFLEDGEQCDCGSLLECNSTGAAACCNATTCTLHGHAKCAVGPCCSGCQFKKQGIMCRPRQTECDLEEVCTGKSQECPGNYYRQDGTPCRNDTAYCFEGGCRTHIEQCEFLWGKGTKTGQDVCFEENTAGSRWSNCGKDDLNNYKKCAIDDVKCGTVQCSETANRFPIPGGNKGARSVSHYITVNGVSVHISCRQGVTDLGADLDNPTLTQQGTRCADGRICIDHKCQNLTSLDFIKRCANNNTCLNGGVCNNMGNCHCPVGFACPDCLHSGEGGSKDSGNLCYVAPKDDQGGLSTLAKSMLILFLGVLPVVVVGILLLFKFRSKLPSCRVPQRLPRRDPKPGTSRSDEKNLTVPDVGFTKSQAQPSAPKWPPEKANENSYTNKTFLAEKKPSPQVSRPPATPGRAPPLPPPGGQAPKPALPKSGPPKPVLSNRDPPPPYSKPLKPVKPNVKPKPNAGSPLPPLRPVNVAGNPRSPPPKLPPVAPRKPPTK